MSLHDDASLATVLAQLDDSTNQTWKAKRAGWAKLVRAQAAELDELRSLARRSRVQLRKWASWYGNADHAARGLLPLPPAGDVELTDDIDAALAPQENPR